MKQPMLYGFFCFGLAGAISGLIFYFKQEKNKEDKTNGKPKENK